MGEEMPPDLGTTPITESVGRGEPEREQSGRREHEFGGAVDLIGPDRVVGWAWDAADPQARLTVWLEVNGAIVARTTADIFREDLLEDGIGDGRHGFDLPLPGIGPGEGDAFRCLVSGATVALAHGAAERLAAIPEAGNIASPVFIIGSPRAGTTVLASALRRAGYFGYDEGHLLNLLTPIKRLIEEHYSENRLNESGQLLSRIGRDELTDGILHVFAKLQLSVTSGGAWFDKTPGPLMIHATEVLSRRWPTASFIFAKRRGIENIVSRLKKFPNVAFEAHCASWAEEMAAWRGVCGSGIRKIEIDQYDMARRPVLISVRLGLFLGLRREQIGMLRKELMGARPERSDEESAGRVLTLETCGWTEEQIRTFRTICSASMEAYGYTLDERYRVEGGS